MNNNSVKVIESFNITGRGLMTELQHSVNGIPPNTKLFNPKTEEFWIVKKRVLSGTLLMTSSEVIFDCETEFEHTSSRFKTEKDKQIAFEKELEKRKIGVYWYLLVAENKKQTVKPEIGSLLKMTM